MVTTIYRRYEADSVENTRVDSLDVRDFADEVEAGLNGFRPTYVEGYNETHHRGDALLKYIDWTAAYVEEMHKRNYKVLGFSFATGNPGAPFAGDPDLADMQNLCDASWAGCDAVGWHCYWGPAGFTPYNAFRFTAAHTQGPHPPFIVSECGRDAVDGGGSGWKASGLTAEQYVAELAAYGKALAYYDYVIGGVVFTATPTVDWAAFSTEGLPLAGIPKLGPHCILPVGGDTLAWAQQAPIVKQVDRTDVLRAVAGAAPAPTPAPIPTPEVIHLDVKPIDQGLTYLCGEYANLECFASVGAAFDVAAVYQDVKGKPYIAPGEPASFDEVKGYASAAAKRTGATVQFFGNDGFIRDDATRLQAVRDGWFVITGVQEPSGILHYVVETADAPNTVTVVDSYPEDGSVDHLSLEVFNQAVHAFPSGDVEALAYRLAYVAPVTPAPAPPLTREAQIVTILSVIGDKTYMSPPDLFGIQLLVQHGKALFGA